MHRVITVLATITLLCLSCSMQADVFNLGPGYTNLETVVVGDPGNAPDYQGCGAVGYSYNIGKYEVTAKQYADFLNNKAIFDDIYGLYNPYMMLSDGCQIRRNGDGTHANPYVYTVANDWANRPVNFVSYWDSFRFANWLSNGQGDGDTETGTYNLNGAVFVRNADWRWAVTTEDEWYKAAYYKGSGTHAGYWIYPTSSNTAPGADMADPYGNNANCFTDSSLFPIEYIKGIYTTVVGEFQNSASPYGTFDQAGNVWEWMQGSSAVLRGGSYDSRYTQLQSLSRNDFTQMYPAMEASDIGFRVSAVPEPSSLLVLLTGLSGLFLKRKNNGVRTKF